MPAVSSLSHWVKQAAAEAGFELAGVATVGEFSELEYFPQWIAEGRAGEMRYLEARSESGELKRASLRHVAPWARSVIVCAINYNAAQPYSTTTHDLTRGWISRYAWTQRDYHDVVKKRLHEIEERLREEVSSKAETRCYVDTGPLVERVYAKYAGVGWIGKNTCVINQRLGSWLFLGIILTSLELEPDIPAPDRCGSCARCLDACPTGAFLGPYELDPARCISYLTIEKRGALPADLRTGMGRHVFGCDICQDVCPWNRKAPATQAEEFQPRPELVNPALDWLATISEQDYRNSFRGSPVKRAQRSGIRRNAVVAMGNSGDRQYIPLLEKLVSDSDESLAEHARWALERLSKMQNSERT
ncbi:MAG TPA: tRNA epoxyqueuosine(34) reductase QueG [Terriglobales bacterium]|nr:tRNA epoxyqueuosine(34) reductase QueG [Terriglobales bacterium]